MKKRQTAVQASTIAKVVALSIFLGGSGVGYVFQKSQINGLIREKDANAEAIRDLDMRRAGIKYKLEQETTRERLEASAKRFHLPLQEPPRDHTITLIEPAMERVSAVSLATQK